MTFTAPRVLLTMLLLSAVACGSSSSPSETADAAPAEDASPAEDAGDAGDAALRDASADASADANPDDVYVPPNTGGCTYTNVSGTATITSITAPSANENACSNDGRHVGYTFLATGAAADAGSPTEHLFTIGSGEDPPNGCLAALGITVGAQVPATEQMETGGACDPFIYSLTVDTSTCTAQCGQ